MLIMGKGKGVMYVDIRSGEGGIVCGYQLWGRFCMWISALGKGVMYVEISSGKGGDVCGYQL